MYKDSDVLIFDEATSALDNQTEQKIMQQIAKLKDNQTVFIIAHRLTTLKKCTQVIELEGGKVLQSGTYKEIVGEI